MFLSINVSLKEILENIPGYMEEYSVFTSIITGLIAGSFWVRKYLKEKRIEAFFGFYSKLSFLLYVLQTDLNKKHRLNVKEPSIGNIFTLMYTEICPVEISPTLSDILDDELQSYIKTTQKIKELLISTDSNVYPSGSDRNEWYSSQRVLYSFCDFLEDNEKHHRVNVAKDNNNVYKHITKCNELIKAIEYIQESIEHMNF